MRDDNDHSAPPEDQTTQASPARFQVSEKIEHYRLLKKIGEGGMGEVYEAEQLEPVRRRVALKLIKWGMDTKQVIARFESERQALALMDHPSVAKVFDAGATEKGRPYFSMEYVQGIPITEHCDRHRLNTRERIELFLQVCEGVQHAHQKAIIHRDLKPSNVLISLRDDKPVPKIIDFGVAKATIQRLTERTVFTELGQLIGTPEYMSPEQAEMTAQDIDTRTDVYSLGAVLYELLVGTQPFAARELRQSGFDEIRRKIREDEPPRPSTRIHSLGEAARKWALNRRTNPVSLRNQLRGDLDWITMKALEKDRTRRYASPSELAADLQRHLKHEPVMAVRPSRFYRMGKFVKRHRLGVIAAGLIVGALVSGTAAAIYGMVRARQAEAEAKQVSEFLVGLFQVSDPSEARGNTITAREILDEGAERIMRELEDQPLIQARMMGTMGKVYQGLGLHPQAKPLLTDALETRRRVLGDDHPATLESIDNMGDLLEFQGRLSEAEPYYREALEGRRRVLGDDHPDTLESVNDMGSLLEAQGKLSEAEPYYREALEGRRRVLGNNHPEALESINALGSLLQAQGKLSEAEPYWREALEGRRRVLGDDHPATLISINNLGLLLQRQGKLSEAEPYYREALEGYRRVLGDDHPYTLISINNLGYLLQALGKLSEAERYWQEALEGNRRVLGDDHPTTLISINNMGYLLQRQGKFTRAEVYYREALTRRRRVLGDDHADTLKSINNMGSLLQAQGKLSEAERYYHEALEGRRRELGEDHPDTLTSINDIGSLLQLQGRLSEAERYYRQALEGRRQELGDNHPDTLTSLGNLGDLYTSMGRFEEAEPLLSEAIEGVRRSLPREHVLNGMTLRKFGRCLTGMENYPAAEAALLEAHEILVSALGAEHAQTLEVIPDLVALYGAWAKPDAAAEWRAKLPEPGEPKTAR